VSRPPRPTPTVIVETGSKESSERDSHRSLPARPACSDSLPSRLVIQASPIVSKVRVLRRLLASALTSGALGFGLLVGGVAAQAPGGTTTSTIGGAALGMYSAGAGALLGSLLPCNRTLAGKRCVTAGASVGAGVGLAMGGVIGSANRDAVVVRLEGAGYGLLIGAAAGIALRSAVRQYQWEDAFAVAAYGAAVGAAPVGTALGAAAGAAVGGVVWWVFDKAGLPDLALFTLAGAGIGAMVDWTYGAATVERPVTPAFMPSISIPIG